MILATLRELPGRRADQRRHRGIAAGFRLWSAPWNGKKRPTNSRALAIDRLRTAWFTLGRSLDNRGCGCPSSGRRSDHSGDTECAAWQYPGTNGACVIMAGVAE